MNRERLNFIIAITLLGLWIPSVALAQSTKNLHPVLITSKSGYVDPETRRILVENFSSAIRESSLKTLGQQFYGTDKSFGYSGSATPGPISSLRKMLVNMDLMMATRIRSIHHNLKAPATDNADNAIHFYWTTRTFGSKVLPINSSIVGMLFKILTPSPNKDSNAINPFAIQLGSQLMGLETAREAEIQGGMDSLAAESKSAYSQLRDLNQGAWLPLYFKAGISIDRTKTVKTSFMVSMIPVGFSLPKDTMDEISIESVIYQPKKENADILQISTQRTYSPSGGNTQPAIVQVSFGPLDPSTMTSSVCTGDACMPRLETIPTITAVMTGSWYKKAFASALSLNQFKMMISSLGIDLKTLAVDSSSSELPVMVKTYTFGWKTIDTKRNVRPFNPLEAIQKSIIGDRVSDGISGVIQPASDQAEQSINRSVKAIIDLFN
jgi:hypothetical protein